VLDVLTEIPVGDAQMNLETGETSERSGTGQARKMRTLMIVLLYALYVPGCWLATHDERRPRGPAGSDG
jgi:hypothetical protein